MGSLHRNVFDREDSGYIDIANELNEYLEEKYSAFCGRGFDYHVSNRNDRWYFFGPEKLTETQLRFGVAFIVMDDTQSSHWDSYFHQGSLGGLSRVGLKYMLSSWGEQVFQASTEVTVLDIVDGGSSRSVVRAEEDLERVLGSWPRRGTRLILINSERTTRPLPISSAMACKLFSGHGVHPDFLRVLLSFGKAPDKSEASSAYQKGHVVSEDQFILFYKLNYVEPNRRLGNNPWSTRHCGIYHERRMDSDLFILSCCAKDTALCSWAESLHISSPNPQTGQRELLQSLQSNPKMLHLLVLSFYLDNWRPYFRSLGSQFTAINNQAMVADIHEAGSSFERVQNVHVAGSSFKQVQSLRHLHDISILARACCRSNEGIIETLSGSNIFLPEQRTELASFSTMVHSYIESGKVLEAEVRNSIELAGYTLTVHNQVEMAKLDEEIRDMTKQMTNLAEETTVITRKLQDLTQHSADEGLIISVITIISAVYLPGSFVATIFGMNFFTFDTVLWRIQMANDFWIFVVLWLSLALITGGLYGLTYWARRNSLTVPWSRRGRFRRDKA